MRIVTTSFAACAAFGLLFGASAFACEFHAQHVTASATPAPAADESMSTVDPVHLAQLDKAAILPAAPKEEAVEDTEAN